MDDEGVVTVNLAVNRLTQVILRPEVRARYLGRELTAISSGDVLLLRALAEVGPIRLSDLAEYQGVDKSTISPHVARLELAGLVDRRPDPDDGRAALVRLSPKGRGFLRRVRNAAGRVYAEVMQDWTEEEVARLGELATRLADSFERLVAHDA